MNLVRASSYLWYVSLIGIFRIHDWLNICIFHTHFAVHHSISRRLFLRSYFAGSVIGYIFFLKLHRFSIVWFSLSYLIRTKIEKNKIMYLYFKDRVYKKDIPQYEYTLSLIKVFFFVIYLLYFSTINNQSIRRFIKDCCTSSETCCNYLSLDDDASLYTIIDFGDEHRTTARQSCPECASPPPEFICLTFE